MIGYMDPLLLYIIPLYIPFKGDLISGYMDPKPYIPLCTPIHRL